MSWITKQEFMPDDPEEDNYEEDEFEAFDCHMSIDRKTGNILGCGMAGTEECDFECPYARMFGHQ